MKKGERISVVVLHYGHGKEVLKCLDALSNIRRNFKLSEIIFVDNNVEKTDRAKILKKYTWIRYLASPKNLGWSGGHNFGFREATGDYIFSLDSDVVIDVKSFGSVYEEIKNNGKRGIVSPRIRNLSGKFFGNATLELTPLRGIFYLSFLKKNLGNPIVKNHEMKDWDRMSSKNVETVQLGAFMMRRSAYEDIGGFDENLFLYFGENDVSVRLRRKGWKIFFDSKAEAIHLESNWTPKNTDNIKKIWSKNRFYYFKKHYGLFKALTIEVFSRVSKELLMFLAIIALGTFLRFYKIGPGFVFNGEMGYDYTTIRDYVLNHQIPLIGPRTSHEWFFIGPIFYWIFGILLPLFNWNVLVGSIFMAVVGSATIFVCYLTLKSLFDKRTALISSFLLAISPLWLSLTRNGRFNSITALLFFPYYYFLVKATEDRGKSLFLLGLTLGIMFSFFPAPILLLPAAVVALFIYRKEINKKYYPAGIIGMILPNLTYLYYDATHKFQLIGNILAWIPYRVLGFFGLYPKNNADTIILKENFVGLYNFFRESWVAQDSLGVLILFFAVLATVAFIKKNRALKILLIVFIVGFLGLFVHGNPPAHYYLIVFPVPLIFLALTLDFIWQRYKPVSLLALAAVFVINMLFFFSDKWFYINPDIVSADHYFVPLKLQLQAASFIVNDAGGKQFAVNRIGPFDYFHDDFSLNYRYLIDLDGGKIDDNAKLKYTIYEDTSTLPRTADVHWFANLAVTKNVE